MRSKRRRTWISFAFIGLLLGLASSGFASFVISTLEMTMLQFVLCNTSAVVLIAVGLTRIPYDKDSIAEYKGREYYVHGRAIDKSTDKEVILYEDDNGIHYTRTVEDFTGKFTGTPNLARRLARRLLGRSDQETE